ncbi:hypothetical protein, partial [Xanthomonas graminis]|uniref:hypothetical protein n=1 Tax=Xanthomonas graminis TaxID=3390026 RepID=UPI001C37AC6E
VLTGPNLFLVAWFDRPLFQGDALRQRLGTFLIGGEQRQHLLYRGGRLQAHAMRLRMRERKCRQREQAEKAGSDWAMQSHGGFLWVDGKEDHAFRGPCRSNQAGGDRVREANDRHQSGKAGAIAPRPST